MLTKTKGIIRHTGQIVEIDEERNPEFSVKDSLRKSRECWDIYNICELKED